MIKNGTLVKPNCTMYGLINALGIDPTDAYLIQNKIGVVSKAVGKEKFSVNFRELNNGFDYLFEKKYLMEA